MQAQFGARIVIRDCAWIALRAYSSEDGDCVQNVDVLSELVSSKSARFLTRLGEDADAIRVIDSAETPFEQNLTQGFEKTPTFIEKQRRQVNLAEARIRLWHKATMHLALYQFIPALQVMKQNYQPVIAGVENSNAELKHLQADQADRYAERPRQLKTQNKEYRINKFIINARSSKAIMRDNAEHPFHKINDSRFV